jgi:glycosyltransferase involved in cell wall biosynthesis
MTNTLALIPAFDESARVGDVVTGARIHLPVLVVDDGSADETFARAQEAGATVLRQDPNQGKGAALRAGFRWALAEGYDAVLTLDADGQHDPADIPMFLEAYAKSDAHQQGSRPADLIIGARDFRQIPLVRRVANTLGRWSFSWALGQPVLDNQSGYRLISRRLLEATLSSRESGFEFEVEMIVICVQRGYVLDWVPIRTIYAGEASHINPAHHMVNFLRVLRETRQRVRET